MGIHIHCVVSFRLSGCGNELAHHIVVVGTAGILGANGNLLFGTLQTVTYTTHIHGNHFRHTGRDRSGAAMANLFVNRDMDVSSSFRCQMIVGKVFGKAQEDAYAELVIQETALEITGSGFSGAGIKTDNVTNLNTQFPGIGGGGDILVQYYFRGVPVALGVAVVTVDVN